MYLTLEKGSKAGDTFVRIDTAGDPFIEGDATDVETDLGRVAAADRIVVRSDDVVAVYTLQSLSTKGVLDGSKIFEV